MWLLIQERGGIVRLGQPVNEADRSATPLRIPDTLGIFKNVGVDGDQHGQFS